MQNTGASHAPQEKNDLVKVWSCKIGWTTPALLGNGADAPMRRAVEEAFFLLTGHNCTFIFSGWAAELDESELRCLSKKEHPDGIYEKN